MFFYQLLSPAKFWVVLVLAMSCSSSFYSQVEIYHGEQLMKKWDGSVWVNDLKVRNHFSNDFEQCIIDTTEMTLWDLENQVWLPFMRTSYLLDENGNSTVSDTKFASGGQYEDYLIQYSFFDDNNLVVYDSSIYYSAVDEMWVVNGKSNYAYDANGRLLSKTTSSWSGSWILGGKEEYTYTTEGNVLQILTSVFQNDNWVPTILLENTYVNNLLSSYAYSFFNGSSWEIQTKTDMFYNNQDLVETSYYYDYSSGAPILTFFQTYTYDNNLNLITLEEQNVSENVYTNFSFSTFSDYCMSTVLVEDEAAIDFSVYPNPCDDVLTIQFAHDVHAALGVFDMHGRCVKELRNLRNLESIDVSDLSSGIYLLKVNEENLPIQTLRLVVH